MKSVGVGSRCERTRRADAATLGRNSSAARSLVTKQVDEPHRVSHFICGALRKLTGGTIVIMVV
jgi:hypothetical protein